MKQTINLEEHQKLSMTVCYAKCLVKYLIIKRGKKHIENTASYDKTSGCLTIKAKIKESDQVTLKIE